MRDCAYDIYTCILFETSKNLQKVYNNSSARYVKVQSSTKYSFFRGELCSHILGGNSGNSPSSHTYIVPQRTHSPSQLKKTQNKNVGVSYIVGSNERGVGLFVGRMAKNSFSPRNKRKMLAPLD